MTPLLKAEALEAFYGPSQILHGIGFEVHPGQQIALLGRNGMGKTTLIRSIIGLVRDRRGSLLLRGKETIAAAPEAIARSGVALVPEGRGIFGSLSVIENLIMASRGAAAARKPWTLERVFNLFPRLKQRRHHGGHQLSGGEQQMLAIGRALMTNPDLLLVDEAAEGLAPLVAKDIWRTIAAAGAEGIATIVADKDFRSLARIASHALVLSKGQIVFSGEPRSLAADPGLMSKYLGV
jgi:branched-chain amino acid transport system ATP-binding protein